MAPHHVAQAQALGGDGKTYLIADFADAASTSRAIHDPFGQGLEEYRQMADELDDVLPRVIRRLQGDAPSAEAR